MFISFWIVFAILFGLNQHSRKSSDLPRIIKRGVIKVCGEEDLFSFYMDKQGFQGFHYELAKAFADKYDLKLEYIGETDFRKRLKYLQSGQCDILSGPLPVVAELRGSIVYTEPILKSYHVLIQRKEKNNGGKRPIRDQLLLGGKSIAFTAYSPNIYRIRNLAIEISDPISISQFQGYSTEDLIKAVSNHLIDFAVCDQYVANSYLNQYTGIDIKTNVGFTQLQAWAVRPENNSLLDSLNLFITDYKKSPEFTRLLKKYAK
ncbi:MAG: transporter substrate-binding domain-containing protein [Bacteroidales bacterium]|nr:transporter substrate-binding domain-containing protein [Bacteroidales bacterium]